jgi:hypothetical protein
MTLAVSGNGALGSVGVATVDERIPRIATL